jgi:hypothetical protein
LGRPRIFVFLSGRSILVQMMPETANMNMISMFRPMELAAVAQDGQGLGRGFGHGDLLC